MHNSLFFYFVLTSLLNIFLLNKFNLTPENKKDFYIICLRLITIYSSSILFSLHTSYKEKLCILSYIFKTLKLNFDEELIMINNLLPTIFSEIHSIRTYLLYRKIKFRAFIEYPYFILILIKYVFKQCISKMNKKILFYENETSYFDDEVLKKPTTVNDFIVITFIIILSITIFIIRL